VAATSSDGAVNVSLPRTGLRGLSLAYVSAVCHFAATATVIGSLAVCAAAETGYQKEITVAAATRLDWTFVISNQSVVDPPEEWLQGYDSTRQRYEQFVPPASKGKNDGLPMVLFVSAGDSPAGWNQLETVCKQKGILFASPYGAGNNTPMPRRVRLILDVLDDVRRQHKIDPDRTYIAGFSGGARVALAVAFALPELFGGAIPVCAGGDLRDETWLRHRAIDRLSIAFLTGPDDFNLGEVERFRGPMFSEIGIRTKVTVVPKLGHAIPDARSFQTALDWLDAGAADRRKFAAQYPASHLTSDRAPGREEQARMLLQEAGIRIKDRKKTYSGLMQLQGVMTRWSDLPAGESAKRTLLEYERDGDKAWEQDDIAEQRRFLIARARGLDAYASGKLPDQYARQRPDMARAAVELWETIVNDGQDAKAVAEGKRRIPILQKLAEK
jgi:predicted esterase